METQQNKTGSEEDKRHQTGTLQPRLGLPARGSRCFVSIRLTADIYYLFVFVVASQM